MFMNIGGCQSSHYLDLCLKNTIKAITNFSVNSIASILEGVDLKE